jgi:hypothetical protein
MICPFCQREFIVKDAKKECRTCASFGGCRKVKCPWCGYESPQEPNFVERLRKLKKTNRSSPDEKQ